MPRITALEPQRFARDRLSVHLDGQYAFGLAATVAVAAGLQIGTVLDAAAIERLQAQDRRQRALDRALEFLAFRPRSEREIRDRLTRAGYEPELIDAAVERLRSLGYVSDAEFARYWVENRAQHSPRGDRLLALELRQKGVERSVIETTLAETEADPVAAAVRAGRRKAQQLAALDPPLFRQRLGAHLARRGFDWETIRAAVTTLRAEVAPSAVDDEA